MDVAEFGVIERDDGDKKKLDRFPKGHRVSIFLTDDELKKIEIMSGLSKMKKPKAIKKLAFSNLENFTAMLEMKPTLDKFYNELGKQGVNLNQAVKRLNRGEKTPDILETIKKTNDMIGEILRIRIAITAELNRKRL